MINAKEARELSENSTLDVSEFVTEVIQNINEKIINEAKMGETHIVMGIKYLVTKLFPERDFHYNEINEINNQTLFILKKSGYKIETIPYTDTFIIKW